MVFSFCHADLGMIECSIGMLTALFLAVGFMIFRKIVANDILGINFSFIGGVVISTFVYLITFYFIQSTKISLIIGVIAGLAGGFGGGIVLPDGESDSEGGNYDEA